VKILAGNAGAGRPKGSLNKRTAALMEMVEAGESPAAFGLRIMRDETQPLEVRLNAARMVAPYVHARPSPAGETVSIDLPEAKTPEDILQASTSILTAVAEGEMSVNTGRDLKRAGGWTISRGSARRWRPHWLPASLIRRRFDPDATSRPGSGWSRNRTRAEARRGSATSPGRAIDTCARCSVLAPWP
jgi:hypothetical protein